MHTNLCAELARAADSWPKLDLQYYSSDRTSR